MICAFDFGYTISSNPSTDSTESSGPRDATFPCWGACLSNVHGFFGISSEGWWASTRCRQHADVLESITISSPVRNAACTSSWTKSTGFLRGSSGKQKNSLSGDAGGKVSFPQVNPCPWILHRLLQPELVKQKAFDASKRAQFSQLFPPKCSLQQADQASGHFLLSWCCRAR